MDLPKLLSYCTSNPDSLLVLETSWGRRMSINQTKVQEMKEREKEKSKVHIADDHTKYFLTMTLFNLNISIDMGYAQKLNIIVMLLGL